MSQNILLTTWKGFWKPHFTVHKGRIEKAVTEITKLDLVLRWARIENISLNPTKRLWNFEYWLQMCDTCCTKFAQAIKVVKISIKNRIKLKLMTRSILNFKMFTMYTNLSEKCTLDRKAVNGLHCQNWNNTKFSITTSFATKMKLEKLEIWVLWRSNGILKMSMKRRTHMLLVFLVKVLHKEVIWKPKANIRSCCL